MDLEKQPDGGENLEHKTKHQYKSRKYMHVHDLKHLKLITIDFTVANVFVEPLLLINMC